MTTDCLQFLIYKTKFVRIYFHHYNYYFLISALSTSPLTLLSGILYSKDRRLCSRTFIKHRAANYFQTVKNDCHNTQSKSWYLQIQTDRQKMYKQWFWQMSNASICWLFFVLYDNKLNIFGFWTECSIMIVLNFSPDSIIKMVANHRFSSLPLQLIQNHTENRMTKQN